MRYCSTSRSGLLKGASTPSSSSSASNPLLLFLFVVLLLLEEIPVQVEGCGPGRSGGRRRGPRKLTPLVFKQHVPNVAENTLTASGLVEGRIGRNDTRFKDLVPNYNQDIIFKDEEGTGADRLMTQRCKEKLNTLAISVMNQWPGVRLLVTEGWDEEGYHSPDSLHYEGRAVDITTSDRDRSKYGMLARLAVEAGFDWVYYESRAHIHCSVKSESSQAAKYGGCFAGDTLVHTSTGTQKKISELRSGEHILTADPTSGQLTFTEVLLFLDFDPKQKREFLQISLASGRTLTVTPTHLVLKGSLSSLTNRPDKNSRTVFAHALKVGDKMLVTHHSGNAKATFKLKVDVIVDIRPVLRTGVFAPLTESGTLVVNDVLASCYATVDSQSLAHWAFSPVRLYFNMKHGVYRFWKIVSGPFSAWTSSSTHKSQISHRISNRGRVEDPSSGIFWYAKLLYVTANYLVPSHMHDE